MKSGYVYLTEDEMIYLRSLLTKTKDVEASEIVNKIDFMKKNFATDKIKIHNTYKTSAFDKIMNINPDLITNEEVVIDEDALVSTSKQGAYVHAWIWVENSKPKRTRKKATEK